MFEICVWFFYLRTFIHRVYTKKYGINKDIVSDATKHQIWTLGKIILEFYAITTTLNDYKTRQGQNAIHNSVHSIT